jgi:hypothetical protein
MASKDSEVMPEPGRDRRLWFITTPAGSTAGSSRSIAVLPGGANTPNRRTELFMRTPLGRLSNHRKPGLMELMKNTE